MLLILIRRWNNDVNPVASFWIGRAVSQAAPFEHVSRKSKIEAGLQSLSGGAGGGTDS